MTQTTQKEKTLLSPRIPRDTEHERYHRELGLHTILEKYQPVG